MTGALGLAALTYCFIVGALVTMQRRMLYAPDRARPSPEDHGAPDMRQVRLATNDGLDLTAWYRPPADRLADAGAVVIYFHGNNEHLGTRAEKIRPFLDAGYGGLLMSYRGYAGNPGRPTEAGLYADGRAALDFVRAEGFEAARTVIYGESLGSGVAVQMAQETPPAALILEAPFSSVVDVAARRFPIFPVRMLMRDRFESIVKIGDVAAPVLVLHGELDRTVPVHLGRRVLEAAGEPKEGKFYPQAAHRDLHEHGAADVALDFVRRHVGAREATSV